jgi:hypothetical protein
MQFGLILAAQSRRSLMQLIDCVLRESAAHWQEEEEEEEKGT